MLDEDPQVPLGFPPDPMWTESNWEQGLPSLQFFQVCSLLSIRYRCSAVKSCLYAALHSSAFKQLGAELCCAWRGPDPSMACLVNDNDNELT